MSTTDIPETGARARTRRAILGAAARVLGRDHGATLADVAAAAEVGRSTLHRYFPDRDELVRAVIEDSLEAIEASTRAAALEEGPPLEAMRRLVAAMVEMGDRLIFLWGDPRVLEGYPGPDDPDCEPVPDPVIALIERGQAAGVFDAEVGAAWIQHVLWSMVYTGVEDAGRGLLPRHGVTATVLRTFEHGIVRTGSR